MGDVTTDINQTHAMRIAQRRVEGFGQQFGEAHRNLARHAAFPLVLTPDLLYQMWANFIPEAPWAAVAHVLLSRLCRQVGYEMYEMDIADRNFLLRELKEEVGQERFNELGEFLLDYVAQRLTDDDADTRDLREAQEWTALAYTKPDEVARELVERLGQRMQQEDMGEVLRLASLVETLAEPLLEAGFEPLLFYSRGVDSLTRSNQVLATSKLKKLLALNTPNFSFTQRILDTTNFSLPKAILDATNFSLPKSILDATNFTLPKGILDATNFTLPKGILDTTNFTLPKDILDATNFTLPKGILDATNFTLPKGILDATNFALPKNILDSINFSLPKNILDATNSSLPKGILDTPNFTIDKGVLDATNFSLTNRILVEQQQQSTSITPKISDLKTKDNFIHKFITVICSDSSLIESAIESDLSDRLSGQTVTSHLIPDDNNEGTIDEVGEIKEIKLNLNNLENYENYFVIPFSLKIDCQLTYFIYNADYYAIEDEESSISILENDWNDHYSWVGQYYLLIVEGLVSVYPTLENINYQNISDDEAYEIMENSQISIDSLTKVEIVDND